MIYGRRVTGTRQRVNWYRGSPSRTSALPGSFNESTTGPTQKTHYDNTEDTTKDPDNPAADGAGSRHNYTVIGQTGLTYDNNRNVLADGTREFRYSYNNQLRRVWRKSDGAAAADGLLAKYREDAFGRRVYAESYWELSRRDVMDTRFGVDVNVDADGDGNAITYLNGGITSTIAPPPGQTDQRTSWDSRIRRNITNANESHYFDFDVTVPSFTGPSTYLGLIAYDRFELRIFSDKYEFWDTAGPTLLGDMFPAGGSTLGRHNIGIRAGQGYGVWLNGSQVPNLTAGGSIGLIANPQAKFGAAQYGLTLWENLCYLKSYSRASAETIPAPGVPVVDVLKFDGPRPCVTHEVFVNTLIVPKVIDKEDGTSCDVMEDGGFVETQLKPNGREHVADVIQPSQDAATYDSTGNRSTLEEPQPGDAIKIHVDAVGTTSNATRLSTTAPIEMPCWGSGTLSFESGGYDNLCCIAVGLGPKKPKDPTVVPTRANPEQTKPAAGYDGEKNGEGDTQIGATACLCQESDVSVPTTSHVHIDTSVGLYGDYLGGNGFERGLGIQLCGGNFLFPLVWPWDPDADWGATPEQWKEAAKETAKEVREKVVEFTRDTIIEGLQELGVDAGTISTITSIITYASTVQSVVGQALVDELLDTVVGLAKVLATPPTERIKEGLANLAEVMDFLKSMGDMTKEDWEELLKGGLTEAFKELSHSDLTPEAFSEGLTNPCLNTDEGLKRTATAQGVVGVIVLGAIIAYFTAGAGATAKAAKAEKRGGVLAKLISRVWPKHHAFPKYLGGNAKQKLVKIPRKEHEALHSALDKWKNGKYSRRKSAEHFADMDRKELVEDLREFYKNAEGGRFKKYLADFENALED